MNTKWIQLLVTVAISFIAMPALSQSTQHHNVAAENDIVNITDQAWSASADTMASVLPDSMSATLTNGWYKVPGTMPMFIPGSLPNSMSVLTPPPIDEKMIISVKLNNVAEDSTKSTDIDKP